jgi:hypothetical protein
MKQNPFTPPTAPVADVAPSLRRLSWALALRIWWSFEWRSAVHGFVGGFVFGALAGAIAGASGHLDKARVAGGTAGYVTGILCSLPALKQAIEKHSRNLAALRI